VFDGFVLASLVLAVAFGASLGAFVYGWDGALIGAAIMFGIALAAMVPFS
jgi:hypothetical protein